VGRSKSLVGVGVSVKHGGSSVCDVLRG
jgi:hypothetical protein